MSTSRDPLFALTGNLWVPAWAIRPGAYEVLRKRKVAGAMPVWLLLHSWCGDAWKPCYFGREQLGATLGIGRGAITRQLKILRKAEGLLFEVERDVDRTPRHLSPARWALDPFMADMWMEKMRDRLAEVAEAEGHGRQWYVRAETSLEAFERRARILAALIRDDMIVKPKPKRHRNKKSKKIRPAAQKRPRAQNAPQGDVSTTMKVEAEVGGNGPGPSRNGRNPESRSSVDAVGKNGRVLHDERHPPHDASDCHVVA